MKDAVAIIPARAGSKSVKDKNIALLNGHPLIAYSIMVAKMSANIDRVLVSTDSEEYRDICLSYGAEVPFIRPPELATDKCDDQGFLIHAMQWLEAQEQYCPEYWVHLRPTTPLRQPELIDQAIEKLKTNKTATSLRSAHEAPESPFKWFQQNSDGYFKGLTDAFDKDAHSRPKESFQQVYIPDGYVDVVLRSVVMRQQSVHGDKILSFVSPVCTEVDSPAELAYLEWQSQQFPAHLKDALNQLKKENQ